MPFYADAEGADFLARPRVGARPFGFIAEMRQPREEQPRRKALLRLKKMRRKVRIHLHLQRVVLGERVHFCGIAHAV